MPASNVYYHCNTVQPANHSDEIRVTVISLPNDYLSILINGIIAFVAVGTVVWPRIAEWFIRKYKLIIPSASRYNRREVESSGSDTSANSENIFVYSLPIKNDGNVKLTKCEVLTDCVLQKGKDGISLDEIHCGIPRRFSDAAFGEMFDLSIGDTAYIRFLKFASDQLNQSGIEKNAVTEIKIEDDCTNNSKVSDAIHKSHVATKVEGGLWSLLAKGRVAAGDELKFENGRNVDYFIHMICKAENLKRIFTLWIAIHWSGESVDDENLTIRPASNDESRQADIRMTELLKGV